MGTWTPILASSDFDGIKADVLTAATGLLTIALIIVGLGVVYRLFTR